MSELPEGSWALWVKLNFAALEMRGWSIAQLLVKERGWEGRNSRAEKCGQVLLLLPPSFPSRNLPSFHTNGRGCPGFPTLCCGQWCQQCHGLFTSPFDCFFPKVLYNLLPLAFLWQHLPSLVAHLTGPQILPGQYITGHAVTANSTIVPSRNFYSMNDL